ncbi:MAG: hypothetical protein Alpg2KO_00580 [Alphaproteobacteria bacterium]
MSVYRLIRKAAETPDLPTESETADTAGLNPDTFEIQPKIEATSRREWSVRSDIAKLFPRTTLEFDDPIYLGPHDDGLN